MGETNLAITLLVHHFCAKTGVYYATEPGFPIFVSLFALFPFIITYLINYPLERIMRPVDTELLQNKRH